MPLADTSFSLQEGLNQRIVVKKVDESLASSTTMQDDDELFMSVLANVLYAVEAWIIYNEPANSGTPDFKLAFVLSAGAFNEGTFRKKYYTNVSNVVSEAFGVDWSTTSSIGATSALRATREFGYINPTADALFKTQWAQANSSANAVVVKAGSMLILRALVA